MEVVRPPDVLCAARATVYSASPPNRSDPTRATLPPAVRVPEAVSAVALTVPAVLKCAAVTVPTADTAAAVIAPDDETPR